MKPFWTISQMSTLDGSPKLERQVQKFSLQASQKTAGIKASGYFHLSRNMVTRVSDILRSKLNNQILNLFQMFGVICVVIFILVKFDKIERIYMMGAKLP